MAICYISITYFNYFEIIFVSIGTYFFMIIWFILSIKKDRNYFETVDFIFLDGIKLLLRSTNLIPNGSVIFFSRSKIFFRWNRVRIWKILKSHAPFDCSTIYYTVRKIKKLQPTLIHVVILVEKTAGIIIVHNVQC